MSPAPTNNRWLPPSDADPDQVVEGGMRDFTIDIALRADSLTAMMLAMVTSIALLVVIFSTGYMKGDPGYWRFFCYLSLFVFSMTMLVLSSNFLLLFVFWEAVGLCSYLLIGFWYEKPAAAAAGKKAFLVNRIGDFGFALGLFLIWTTYGTLNYHSTAVVVGSVGATRLGPFDDRPTSRRVWRTASPWGHPQSCASRWIRSIRFHRPPRRSKSFRACSAVRKAPIEPEESHSPFASFCCWGPAARAPSSHSMSGFPTPWRVRRRSAP
jgi:hypothetical protein